MNQVGQIKTFSLDPITAPEGTNIYAFVWDFWDGSTEVTAGTTVQKRLNIGGAPDGEADKGRLDFRCYPVAIDGQSGSIYGALSVNNAPTIYSAEIDNNNGYFPYPALLTVTAYDIGTASPANPNLQFAWYEGDTMLSAPALGVGSELVSGTWAGNGRTVIKNYLADVGTYAATVDNDRVIRCYVYDQDAGTSFIDFPLYGQPTPPPDPLLYADPESPAEASSSTYKVRVGPEQYLTLVAYARDLSGVSQPQFTWTYATADGWQGSTSFVDPAPEALDGGVWKSTSVKYTGTEIVTGTDVSVVTARCHVENNYGEVDVPFVVELLSNTIVGAPTIYTKVGASAEVTGAIAVTTALGTKVRYRVTADDPDYDLVNAEWHFANNNTPLAAGTLQDAGSMFGHTVWLDVTPEWAVGQNTFAYVTVKDRFGAYRNASSSGPARSA